MIHHLPLTFGIVCAMMVSHVLAMDFTESPAESFDNTFYLSQSGSNYDADSERGKQNSQSSASSAEQENNVFGAIRDGDVPQLEQHIAQLDNPKEFLDENGILQRTLLQSTQSLTTSDGQLLAPIVACLLKHCADPNAFSWGDGQYSPPLHAAVRRITELEILLLLLSYYADPCQTDAEGKTALMIAEETCASLKGYYNDLVNGYLSTDFDSGNQDIELIQAGLTRAHINKKFLKNFMILAPTNVNAYDDALDCVARLTTDKLQYEDIEKKNVVSTNYTPPIKYIIGWLGDILSTLYKKPYIPLKEHLTLATNLATYGLKLNYARLKIRQMKALEDLITQNHKYFNECLSICTLCQDTTATISDEEEWKQLACCRQMLCVNCLARLSTCICRPADEQQCFACSRECPHCFQSIQISQ